MIGFGRLVSYIKFGDFPGSLIYQKVTIQLLGDRLDHMTRCLERSKPRQVWWCCISQWSLRWWWQLCPGIAQKLSEPWAASRLWPAKISWWIGLNSWWFNLGKKMVVFHIKISWWNWHSIGRFEHMGLTLKNVDSWWYTQNMQRQKTSQDLCRRW